MKCSFCTNDLVFRVAASGSFAYLPERDTFILFCCPEEIPDIICLVNTEIPFQFLVTSQVELLVCESFLKEIFPLTFQGNVIGGLYEMGYDED